MNQNKQIMDFLSRQGERVESISEVEDGSLAAVVLSTSQDRWFSVHRHYDIGYFSEAYHDALKGNLHQVETTLMVKYMLKDSELKVLHALELPVISILMGSPYQQAVFSIYKESDIAKIYSNHEYEVEDDKFS